MDGVGMRCGSSRSAPAPLTCSGGDPEGQEDQESDKGEIRERRAPDDFPIPAGKPGQGAGNHVGESIDGGADPQAAIDVQKPEEQAEEHSHPGKSVQMKQDLQSQLWPVPLNVAPLGSKGLMHR